MLKENGQPKINEDSEELNLSQQEKTENFNLTFDQLEHEPNQELIPLRKEDHLGEAAQYMKYFPIEEISFWFFWKESLSYIGNYFIERIPFLVSYIFFNLKKDTLSTDIAGFECMYLLIFCALMYDFQEAVAIVLGPYYSQGDVYNYKLAKYRLILLNFVGFLISAAVVMCCKPIYRFLNVEPDMLDTYSNYGYIFFIFIFAGFAVQNFQKGSFFA